MSPGEKSHELQGMEFWGRATQTFLKFTFHHCVPEVSLNIRQPGIYPLGFICFDIISPYYASFYALRLENVHFISPSYARSMKFVLFIGVYTSECALSLGGNFRHELLTKTGVGMILEIGDDICFVFGDGHGI